MSHPIDLVRALAASQERLFELLERVPFGVVGTDGKAPWANRCARQILGEGADYALPPLIRALAGETVLHERVEVGAQIIEVSATPLRDVDGDVIYSVAAIADVTETARTERAYRDLFENAPIGIYRTSPDGEIVMANPALVEMLGFESLDQLNGWNLERDGVHAEYDRGAFKALLNRFGEVRNLEGAWRRRDGSTLVVNENARVVADADGEVLYYEGTIEDITARRSTEEQLRTSREEYRHLVENATDVIYSCDAYGKFTYVNPTIRTVLGFDERDFLGKHFRDIVDPEHREKVEAFYREQFRTRAPNTYYEFPVITADGGRVWIGQNVQTLMNGPWVVGFQAVARDITERKQMQEELARARDAAIESARIKSEFLANVSHEIRTPMNGVIGMADLLVTGALTTEQRDYAQTIRQSADSLLRIVDDILDISKIEAGKLTVKTVDFDLDELVDEITDVFAERAAAKGIRFRSIIYPDVHRQLRGDALRIRQVIVNLVGNAIKFTSEGEVTLSVMQDSETELRTEFRGLGVSGSRSDRETAQPRDRATAEGVMLWFLVNDTGIGIAAADQERLFTPFTQVDAKSNRKFGGTGLGLAISKELVTLLGGRIGLASVAGEGSTFWFTVPLEKDVRTPGMPKRLALAGRRALVVDGDDINRLLVRRHLGSASMHVDEASDAEAAMEAIRSAALSQPYHVVVIDLQLPRTDGLALTRAIRAEEFDVIARTPVVLITAIGRRKSDVEAFRTSGVNAFIIKPVRQSQLASAVAGVIGERTTLPEPMFPPDELEPEETPGRAPRVLVVEDNVVNQKVALGQLRLLGLEGRVAGSGAEALETLRGGARFDLVLLDCQMPDIDGYEVAREIRQLEQGRSRIPIVAMTAYVLDGERERCLDAGMDDYLSKPVSTSRLGETLERWIKMPEPAVDPQTLSGFKAMARANPKFMSDITTLFREDALVRLHDLRDAVAADDGEQLARAAHALKSSSGNVGAKRLYTLCAAIEENARAGKMAGARDLVEQVAAELDVAVAALTRSADEERP